MKKKTKNIVIYIAIVAVLITLLLIFWDYNDLLTIILFAIITVVTSIFTYGNRRHRQ
jgi:Na+/melibiose symporter-like transporter